MENNNERFTHEIEEFYEKYPSVDLDSVPQGVWEQVKTGTPLSSAYGEHCEKNEKIRAQNEKNRSSTPGAIGAHSKKIMAYTESDVRKMSRRQIRENYDAIIKSMQSPGFLNH